MAVVYEYLIGPNMEKVAAASLERKAQAPGEDGNIFSEIEAAVYTCTCTCNEDDSYSMLDTKHLSPSFKFSVFLYGLISRILIDMICL